MSKLAIRLLMLALCTTALALVPTITPAQAVTSSSGHVHKHKKHWHPHAHLSEPWSVGQAPPPVLPYNQAGPICPGLSRGIDCRIFPPPIDVDPDRRVPKF